jgi:NDP-sugar pyrophosphorylase family protein
MRSKARLTITLPRELLAQIDHLIDKRTVRNRSHAIELLLRKSLKPSVSTAVLLAGGSDGAEQPPALLPIQGQPLIIRTINHLIDNGISSFIILAGKSESLIRGYLGNIDNRRAKFHFVNESQPMGTAGALKAAERYISDEPFLVFHADILTDINIIDFVQFHSSQNKLATIAVKPRQAEPDYGKVMMEGSRITDFIPQNQDQGISIVNTGMYLFEPEVLSLIATGTAIWLETGIFPKLAKMGELSAFLFQGIWFDISNSGNYESAQVRWQQKGGDNREGQS